MFFLLASLANIALADECLDVPTSVDQAYTAFNDAETEEARSLIRKTYQALDCQSAPVTRESLMALYQLDALTALAAEDKQGAVYAIIRSITAAPELKPPESMGPEIADMHRSWSARLKDSELVVELGATAQEVWVDGVALTTGQTRRLVEGEHLIQRLSDGGFTSQVVEVSKSSNDLSAWNLNVLADKPAEITPEPKAISVPKKPKNPASKKTTRLAVTLSGVAVAVAGGGVLGWGTYREVQFKQNAFPLENYAGKNARANAIRAEAASINQIYAVGYGLVGVGVVTAGVGIFAMPVSDGGGIRLQGRW